jgi:uncharacterized protein involved in exopolysaccharide biosynthesis
MRDSAKEIWTRRGVYHALFRFKWRAIGFFCTTVTLAVIGLIVVSRTYRSEAKLLIRVGRESVSLDPTATATGQVIGYSSSRETEINSVIEVITGRPILETVVAEQRGDKPFSSPMERDMAVRSLMQKLSAWSPKDTNVVVVAGEGDSPEMAQSTVQAIVDAYVEEHMRVHRTSGSYEFFLEQSEMLKKGLEEASERLRDAKNEYGFVELAGRRASLQKQIGDLETTIRDVDSEVTASQAKIAAMQASLDGLPASMIAALAGGDKSSVNLRQTLFELQAREKELMSQRTANHPSVIAIREQVRELELILEDEKLDRAAAESTVLLEESSKLKSFEARKGKLAEQQKLLTLELQELNQQEAHVNQLQREVDLVAANYKTYSESLEQSRVDQALKTEGITNVSVVQAASFEPKPSSPRKGRTLVLAGLLGMCGAVGLALLSEHLDQSLRFAHDIERHLRLPLLASIPHMRTVPSD